MFHYKLNRSRITITIAYTVFRFTVNLQCGSSTNDDIAFHFDVRGASSNGVIVRNTHKKGTGWGREEKTVPCFPFSSDKFFDMIILVEEHVFKVD